MRPTNLTVIIPTRDRPDLLDESLASLASQHWSGHTWDIVVVDSGTKSSAAATVEKWRNRMPGPVTRLVAGPATGPAASRNLGVRESSGHLLAFLDDDDLAGEGWLEALAESLNHNKLVGSRFDYARLNPCGATDPRAVSQTTLPKVGNMPVASGGGMGCHRSLWEQLGGMNEALRFGEDIDFSLRASQTGTEPALCHEAIYHVRMRRGTAAAFARGFRHGQASVAIYATHRERTGDTADHIGVVARSWAGYILRIPTLRSRSTRWLFAEQLARRVGRLQASLKMRVWYP